jgi:2-C-methyl-D-erythritol 4-phosphate cytidylyltransferase/2-C-methyl-D-erythritol 2,4-cyclodiphosphate synthase
MTSTATVGVVVVAAGAGTRLGADVPKAFVSVGGQTILERSLEPMLDLPEPAQVVVVVPKDQLAKAKELVAHAGDAVSVVAGGATRQASVAAGLAALGADVAVVLVHDAARPFTPTRLFEAVIEKVRASGDGVIPGLPVADTLKRTADGIAIETVDRSELSAVQTPQGFPRQALVAAYADAVHEYTDDAALFAAAGHEVLVVEGDAFAFKITTAWDLRRAEQLAGGPSTSSGTGASSGAGAGSGTAITSVPEPVEGPAASTIRTGIGIDIHAFDDSVPLWLGALHWPDEPGLAGHSDGDALSHAICDALLSAAGLGDLGEQFGSTDPRFAGAHGEVFITATVALVQGAGFRIQNVAVQVIGNRPRLASRRAELEKRMGELVGAPVSIAATTSDGLGFTGTGEGIAAIATALLTS